MNALNSKFMVGGIFFNLQKASDCLNHNILLSKLHFMVLMANLNHGMNLTFITDI
jgi:hypothetical protein